MQILADENVDHPIVEWLRREGHDITEAAAVCPGSTDSHLIEMSRDQGRVLMTFDRDVGRLIHADHRPHPGVIYLRLRGTSADLWESFKRIWPTIETATPQHFVTVRNHQVRRRPLPMEE